MDHAEVLVRLESAFTGPGKLAALDADHSVEGQEVRHHLDTCDACRAELRAWQLTSMALAAATPDSLRAPAEARSRILAAVAATGVPRGAAARGDAAPAARVVAAAPLTGSAQPVTGSVEPPTGSVRPLTGSVQPLTAAAETRTAAAESALTRPVLTALPGGAAFHGEPAAGKPRAGAAGLRFSMLALAAAAAVVLFVTGALLGQPLGLTPQSQENDLTAVVNAADHILQQPGHALVTLKTAAGLAAGSALMDPASNQIVLISQALDPAGGRRYDCWVVRGGQQTWIGLMNFQGTTAYWSGTVSAPAGLGKPGDIIEVRVEGATGAPSLSGTI